MMPPVQTEFFAFQGGLDQVTPTMSAPPGRCQSAQNFEVALLGGYSTVAGYERFDGRPKPSDAVVTYLPASITGAVSVGNTVTGASSSATGYVIGVEAAAIVITKLTGTFTSSEEITVSGTTRATMTAPPLTGYAATIQTLQGYAELAATAYRADIGAVPGSGSVLGVFPYGGHVYAFRNNAGGTAAVMHKATTSGWTTVTTPALAPSGRYEFVLYNFSLGMMMYGVDGKNKAFQFDGTTFTQITTGMTTDTPKHIAAHANHLFLSFAHSVQHSPIGDPTGTWTAVTGAGEINMGDEVTGFAPQPGSAQGHAMTIYSRDRTQVLYGTSTLDWSLVNLSMEAGAHHYTPQVMGQTFALDDRGVTSMAATQNYGNFESANISVALKPWLERYGVTTSGTIVCRDKNQFRVFFENGRAIYLTVSYGKLLGFMPIQFGHSLNAVYSAEVSGGAEEIYAAGTNGYVYQMDRGTSFDGGAIEAFIAMHFNSIKSPRTRKLFRHAAIETSGIGYMSLYIGESLGYGTPSIEMNGATFADMTFSNPYWDTGTWEEGIWDGQSVMPVEHDLTGTAENISLLFARSSSSEPPLTLHGAMIHYTARRQMR